MSEQLSPLPLTAERLAEIRRAMQAGSVTARGKMGADLWRHLDAQAAELAQARAERDAAVAEAAGLRRDRYEALDALADMYHQYCPPPHGHAFTSAGENAADVLEKHGLLPNGEFAAPAWPEQPEAAPAPTVAAGAGERQEGGQGNG